MTAISTLEISKALQSLFTERVVVVPFTSDGYNSPWQDAGAIAWYVNGELCGIVESCDAKTLYNAARHGVRYDIHRAIIMACVGEI